MEAVPVDSRDRDSAARCGMIPRKPLLAVLLLMGAVVVIAPPALWLNAAPDEKSPLPTAEEQLADVRVEGNTTIPVTHIAKFIKTRPGRKYTEKQIRDDVRSLYGTRWFFSVEPRFRRSEKGLVLVFHVIERPSITRVEYKGNKEIRTKKLAAQTGLKPGSPFDISANRQSARRLEEYYKEQGYAFAKVELERGGNKDDREVVFRITEGPLVRVASIQFEGNDFVSGPVLNTKIRTSTAILWYFGGLYDPETIKDDMAALKQYYWNLGFFDVVIKNRIGWNSDRSRATFIYTIKEGPRYKIRKVEIAGNAVVALSDIRSDLTLKAGDYFNAHTLTKDIDNVKARYGQLGRLFAKVEAAPRFFENEAGVADLVIRIDEDTVYKIRRVNVIFREGDSHTKRSAVLNRMRIHPGDLADPALIRASEKWLRGAQIFDDGRRNPGTGPQVIFKRVKPDPKRELEAFRGQNPDFSASRPRPVSQHPLANPDAVFSEGERRYGDGKNPFDLTAIRGQSPKPQVAIPQPPVENQFNGELPQQLPRRIRPDNGDDMPLPFTDEIPPAFHFKGPSSNATSGYGGATIRGQSYNNGIPQPGSPLYNNDPNRPFGPAVREGDLDVIVSETQTGRLMFGVGVNSDAGVVGSIVLNEYNFALLRPPRNFQDLIDGKAFRGNGERFRLELVPGNVVSRYLVSWTDPYIFGYDYSLSVSGFYYNRFFTDWDEQRTGGRISIGKQFTPQFSVSGVFRIEDVELSNPDVPTPKILADSVGSNLLTTLGVNVIHDTRDQAFLPGEGHLLDFLAEQAVGEYQFPKLTLNASQFFTVYQRPDGLGRHILTLRGQLGWTDAGTPIYERFFAGGFQTFRGFEFRGISPRELGVRTGGRWLALGSVEYMLPLMANETLHGVAFTDFGTVENKVGFDDFRLSVGVGLRISIPQMLGPVPLAFDFGFPIMKEKFDDERIFNFYVGFTK